MDDTAFFRSLGGGGNSAAVTVKHMSGNMWSRWRDFLTTDGEKPDRDREREFEVVAADTREALTRSWERGWTTLFAALDPLVPSDLDRTVTIRGEPLSVWQAILRQLTHYAYHTGQIVSAARSAAGDAWVSLSIPRGGTPAFNAKPEPYLDRDERKGT
jgi:hypothetical protein